MRQMHNVAEDVFAMPVDSEFVLVQGRVARNNRLRRMSDASMPCTMSTLAPRLPGRRRNTVGTGYTQEKPASPPSQLQIRRATVLASPLASPAFGSKTVYPRVPPPGLGHLATPPLPALSEDSSEDLSLGMSSCGSLLIDDASMDFTPLTPVMSPQLSPIVEEARPQKTLHHSASLPTMLSKPAKDAGAAAPAAAPVPPTCEEPPVTAPAACWPYDGHKDDVACVLLDKRILMARPRLIRITPPTTA